MTRQPTRGKAMSKGLKAAAAIAAGILLALGILYFSETVTSINRDNPDFSYILPENREGPVQLTTGEKMEIPFVFRIDEGVAQVDLEFAGVHNNVAGIAFSSSSVAVVNGMAQSAVILLIASDEDLKAGSHILAIIARDADSGAIIRTGEILVNFNIHKVIAGCSC